VNANANANLNGNANPNRRRIPGEIPYVSPDGDKTRYYADRFYLNTPTGLLEYQLLANTNEKDVGGGSSSSNNNNARRNNAHVEYCTCGEIRDTTQTHYRGTIRGTTATPNTNNAPPLTRPLFDRAKFIHSLDLSAAIIGTYSVGDFDYLSNEFPMLFPPRPGDDDKRSNNGRHHVPTLVLHGQRGFSLERWSSANTNTNTNTQQHSEMNQSSTTGDTDVAMGIRGGGGECSSQDSFHQNSGTEQVIIESNERGKKPSAEKKRPCLTFGGIKLKLPNTPKRLKKTKKKNAPQKNVENTCRGEIAAKRGSIVEVIVIDSDSEDEPDPKDTAKNTTASSMATKLPPKSPKSPPASSKVADGYSTPSPPRNIQQPRESMPMTNAPPPPELADTTSSSFQSKRLPMPTSSVDSPPKTAASILTRVLGKPPSSKSTMRPIYYDGDGNDSSQDGTISVDDTEKMVPQEDNANEKAPCGENQVKSGWGGVKPVSVFGGEVFFTQVLPRWCPPSSKGKKRRASSGEPLNVREAVRARTNTDNGTAAEYSDDENEDGQEKRSEVLQEEYKEHTTNPTNDDEPEMKTVRGVHHPKFFLLFERSGSLVVIISTSNLTPQNSTEGSWVQRFEPKEQSSPQPTNSNRGSDANAKGNVDHGMPSDFGAVLTDFLKRQSEAAAGGMLPDVFLRRYVSGLSSGLNSLVDQYRFDDAQVHLVSTVPGDHMGGLPRKGHRDATYKPRIAYGPQRVAFILSRTLNQCHIRSARAAMAATTGRLGGSRRMDDYMPWLHPSLVTAKDRLVIQPTSMGGNWTRDDLELIVQSYLQPHWKHPENIDKNKDGLLELMDIVWPSMEYFESIKRKRLTISKKYPEEAVSITKRWTSNKNKNDGKDHLQTQLGGLPQPPRASAPHVFLSSVSFSKLDRSIISRMALFTQQPNTMPYKSAPPHFKSICRLLRLNKEPAESPKKVDYKQSKQPSPHSKEYLSWFMLTSACLSKGAQGQPTPYRDPDSDCMSYSNFELGIMFCSRLVGDNCHDRLYVSDPNHLHGCQCGKGKRWYKARYCEKNSSSNNSFLESVKKVHLPIPYQLRPKPYQEDPESDFMSYTPYMHEIPDGTGCVGNMKLTPIGNSFIR